MQGKRILAAVCGFAALSIAAPASAIMSIPNGWFIEANIGSSNLSNFDTDGDLNSSGIGGNVNVGYKFMPYFAAELGYSRYPNADVEDIFDNRIATIKIYSYDVALRGIWPVADSGFEFFAKVGAARINACIDVDFTTPSGRTIDVNDGSHSASGLYWGVGMQYYWWPELAIIAQYQQAQGSSSTGHLSLLTAGVSFIID